MQTSQPHPNLPTTQPPCPWGRCKAGQVLISDTTSVRWFIDDRAVIPPDPKAMPEEVKMFHNDGVCVVVALGLAPGNHRVAMKVVQNQADTLGSGIAVIGERGKAPPSPATVLLSHLIWF